MVLRIFACGVDREVCPAAEIRWCIFAGGRGAGLAFRSPFNNSAPQGVGDVVPPPPPVSAPMTPCPPGGPNTVNYTPSPRFFSLADSPAARLLSALDLQVLSTPTHLFNEEECTPPSSGDTTPVSDSASDQSTVTFVSLLYQMPALKLQFPEKVAISAYNCTSKFR